MEVVYLILFLGAVASFAVESFATPRHPRRVNFLALGLMLWSLALLIQLLVGFEA